MSKRIEVLYFNRKAAPAKDLEKLLDEKLRGQFFSRIELHESGNWILVALYRGEGKPTQQARFFGPGDLDEVIDEINAVKGEATGDMIAIQPIGSNRFVGTIIYSPKVEVENVGETPGQNEKVNAGPNRRKQRAAKPEDSGTDGGGTQ